MFHAKNLLLDMALFDIAITAFLNFDPNTRDFMEELSLKV